MLPSLQALSSGDGGSQSARDRPGLVKNDTHVSDLPDDLHEKITAFLANDGKDWKGVCNSISNWCTTQPHRLCKGDKLWMDVFEACFGKIETPSAKPSKLTWQKVFYNACDDGSFMASLRKAPAFKIDEAFHKVAGKLFNLDEKSARRYELLKIRGAYLLRFYETQELNSTFKKNWPYNVDSLIKGGADPRWVNENGQNALHMLMRYGRTHFYARTHENAAKIVELAEKLLDAGAKETINVYETKKRFTALQLALAKGHSIELVQLLLENGAHPNIVESGNRYHHPLLLANYFPDQAVEMTSLLRSHRAVLPGEGAM